MQGLPMALAGRDMVGIAFTGSGETLTFSLPLVMAALEEEVRMPLIGGEGPVGIILVAPSRELVRQTFDLVQISQNCMESETVIILQADPNTYDAPRVNSEVWSPIEESMDSWVPF